MIVVAMNNKKQILSTNWLNRIHSLCMTDSCPKIANPSFIVGSNPSFIVGSNPSFVVGSNPSFVVGPVTEGGILEVLMNRIVLINGLSTKLTMRRGRKRFSLEAALPIIIRTTVVTMSENEMVTKFSTIHFTVKKMKWVFNQM